MDIETLRAWIGRSETQADIAAAAPLAGLAALLDHAAPPRDAIPPLAHWLYFLPHARQSDIDSDGHPKRGGFLPPVDLPRRMWAGGQLRFHAPIAIGANLVRRSVIRDITRKRVRAARLVFVRVHHEIDADGVLCISEDQDIVYREAAKAMPPARTKAVTPPRASDATRRIVPDPTQLFRFSALTFNAHRIHYDRDYCRDVEYYPGLVVQGPYIATLLMDHLLRERPAARVSEFQFRGVKPLYDTAPFDVCLAEEQGAVRLWTRDADGDETMVATAVVAA